VLIGAQIAAGERTDPERGKVTVADYTSSWIAHRPGVRVRTVDLYNWLLAKGVSVSMAAKAYRLLRAVLTTAVDGDKILSRNPAGCAALGRNTHPNGRCSPSIRSSTWPSESAADRSATSARCPLAATVFASAETATPQRQCLRRGRRHRDQGSDGAHGSRPQRKQSRTLEYLSRGLHK
jgi:hypothetical protein